MLRLIVSIIAAVFLLAPSAGACPMEGQQHCKGQQKGKGQQHRHGRQGQEGKGMNCRMDAAHDADMDAFHFLLDNRDKITRTVTPIEGGVETVTESDDPEIVSRIREHVTSMQSRIQEGNAIHMRDPLFAEIFANAEKIEMTIEETEKGVRVRETSDDDHVAKMIQAHAEVIGSFIENGRPEVRKNHEVPADR